MHAVLHALSTPRRREILRLLWTRDRPAGEIAAAFDDVSFGAVSQHLRVLEDAGLVRARREGRSRIYAADRDRLGPLKAWLERQWDDALYRLKMRAELESARRGPRPAARARPRATHRRRTRS